MNSEKELKKQIAIYEIERTDSIFPEQTNYLDTLIQIIATTAQNKYYEYQDLKVKANIFKNYYVKGLIVSKDFAPNWQIYINDILDIPINIKETPRYSAILFYENKTTHNIYSIVFGINGYILIKELIVENFGLDILSRIINPDTTKCKSSKQQDLTGTKQGEINVYREFQTLETIIDDFGRIFQELLVNIDIRILENFGIKNKKNSKIEFKKCLTKDSFKINSIISVKQIENILNGCEWAKKQKSNPINYVKILNPKQDKDLIETLQMQLFDSLFKTFKKTPNSYSYDLSHKNFNDYLSAEKYELINIEHNLTHQYNTTITSIDTIFNILNEATETNVNLDTLKSFILKTKINTYSEDGVPLTSDFIFKHLFAEETHKNKKYFLLNGTWYFLIEEFLNSLNSKISQLYINYEHTDSHYIENWNNSKNETVFINKHKSKEKTILIHPNTIDNIEICDFIHYTDDNVYFYFIKQGFRNEIRALCSQIYISAKLLNKDLNTDKKYIKKIYNLIKENNLSNITESNFDNLFNRKIIFVFAFYDNKISSEERFLKNSPEKFGSNIAKYSLLNLIKDMKTIDGIDFQIYQIKK
ncbi:MAG: TIGR04141 family sporadically distributed protein [Endomicrobiaceae bacterium]|nr:TIGR04141 family sporadically distributed protein [Endomicrobiaceae bacterium]